MIGLSTALGTKRNQLTAPNTAESGRRQQTVHTVAEVMLVVTVAEVMLGGYRG